MTICSRNNLDTSNIQLRAFTPEGGRVECASYSLVFKGITAAITGSAVLWTWQLWRTGQLAPSSSMMTWSLAALCMMGLISWHILRGRTTLDASGIEQTWIWRKRVDMQELAYAKLMRVPGLDWLIAPRLYTRTLANKTIIFYVTSPAMLQELKKLETVITAQSLAQ